jgi:hypothetical protein
MQTLNVVDRALTAAALCNGAGSSGTPVPIPSSSAAVSTAPSSSSLAWTAASYSSVPSAPSPSPVSASAAPAQRPDLVLGHDGASHVLTHVHLEAQTITTESGQIAIGFDRCNASADSKAKQLAHTLKVLEQVGHRVMGKDAVPEGAGDDVLLSLGCAISDGASVEKKTDKEIEAQRRKVMDARNREEDDELYGPDEHVIQSFFCAAHNDAGVAACLHEASTEMFRSEHAAALNPPCIVAHENYANLQGERGEQGTTGEPLSEDPKQVCRREPQAV